MKNLRISLFLVLSLFLWCSFKALSPVLAESDVAVTATVPDEIPPSPPILITPENGSYTNNTYPTFSFKKSSDYGSPIWYYQLFLNETLRISELPASLSYKQTSEFELWATDEVISFKLKQPLAEGTYTWKIRVFDTYANQADSAIWTFTIDLTPPFIIVTQVAEHDSLSLSSEDPDSIIPETAFTTQNNQPPINGQSEPGAALKLILSSETNTFSWQTTANSQGYFSFIPDQALPNDTYQVIISASDLATNTTTLKSFWLTIEKPPTLLPPYVFKTLDFLTPTQALTLTEEIAQDYIMPIALIAIAIHLMLFYLATGLPFVSLPGFFLGFFFLPILPFRKKGDDRVFDALSLETIAFAQVIIRKLDQQGVKTLICDRLGRFELRLKPGVYYLKAQVPFYTFPSQIPPQFDPEDHPYPYYGQPLIIGKSEINYQQKPMVFPDSEFRLSIPLDPQPEPTEPRLRTKYRFYRFCQKYHSWPLFLALGLALTGALLFPQRLYLLFIMGLLILLIFEAPLIFSSHERSPSRPASP